MSTPRPAPTAAPSKSRSTLESFVLRTTRPTSDFATACSIPAGSIRTRSRELERLNAPSRNTHPSRQAQSARLLAGRRPPPIVLNWQPGPPDEQMGIRGESTRRMASLAGDDAVERLARILPPKQVHLLIRQTEESRLTRDPVRAAAGCVHRGWRSAGSRGSRLFRL